MAVADRSAPPRDAGVVVAAFVLSATLPLAALASADAQISQKGMRFAPQDISVTAGDTVEFLNDDRTRHHIFSVSGPESFESRLLPPGVSYTVTLGTPGLYQVGCRIHLDMRMSIAVNR